MRDLLRRLRRALARGFGSTDALEPEPPPAPGETLDEHADELDADDAAVFGTTDWVLTARDAVALLIYGAFDPVDPVLSVVTLIDFGGRRSQTIVHARLSPFASQFSVLATLAGAEADDRSRIHRTLLRICTQNGDPAWPLVQRAPTFIAPTAGLPIDVQRDAYRQLLAHTPDVGALAAALAQDASDPWARATARFQHAKPHAEDDSDIDRYVAQAMAPAHVAQEIDALPSAWQSAIDYQAELGRAERIERALPWDDVAAYLAKLLPRS